MRVLNYFNMRYPHPVYLAAAWVGLDRRLYTYNPGAETFDQFLATNGEVTGILTLWEVRPLVCLDKHLALEVSRRTEEARLMRARERLAWAMRTANVFRDEVADHVAQYADVLVAENGWERPSEDSSGAVFLREGDLHSQQPLRDESLYILCSNDRLVRAVDYLRKSYPEAKALVTARVCKQKEQVWVDAKAALKERNEMRALARAGQFEAGSDLAKAQNRELARRILLQAGVV